jgi:hypothetical protein
MHSYTRMSMRQKSSWAFVGSIVAPPARGVQLTSHGTSLPGWPNKRMMPCHFLCNASARPRHPAFSLRMEPVPAGEGINVGRLSNQARQCDKRIRQNSPEATLLDVPKRTTQKREPRAMGRQETQIDTTTWRRGSACVGYLSEMSRPANAAWREGGRVRICRSESVPICTCCDSGFNADLHLQTRNG